jgi:hypothetical protein
MGITEEAVGWVGREPGVALAVAAGLQGFALLLVFWSFARHNRLARRVRQILRGVNGANLEQALRERAEQIERLAADADSALRQARENADALSRALDKVGVVRYDAFADVGGAQSFSLALLDAHDCGVVLSGIHSRADVRVYAKPVECGESPVALTNEERRAIREARPSRGDGARA